MARRQADSSPAGEQERNGSSAPQEQSGKSAGSYGLFDVSWFDHNPRLSQAAGSIPFPYRPGSSVPLTQIDVQAGKYTIPGICVLHWIPTLGYSADAQSPISGTAAEMYARVRESFSGSLQGDAPDMVLTVAALADVFGYITSVKRVFRLLNSYSPDNYLLPNGVLAALGFTDAHIQSLRQHKMELYGYINQLVMMTRKFKCPRVFDLLNRHVHMNDMGYADAASPAAQIYLFKQDAFWKLSMLNTPDGVPATGLAGFEFSSAFAQQFTKTGDAALSLFNIGVEMLNAIAEIDTSYTLFGYFRRAFESAEIFQIDEVDGTERFDLFYNEQVLNQIENSHCVGAAWLGTPAFVNVTQDPKTNAILTKPTATLQGLFTSEFLTVFGNLNTEVDWFQALMQRPIINSRSEMPAYQDVINATRLASYVDFATNLGTPGSPSYGIVCGTECVTQYTVTKLVGSQLNALTPALNTYNWVTTTVFSDWWLPVQASQLTASIVPATIKNALGSFANSLQNLAAFDWAPILRAIWGNVYTGSTAATKWEFQYYQGWSDEPFVASDVHNVTSMSVNELFQLNRVCLYSEFNTFGII